jgi:dihydroxyacetone kinase-like protein
MAPLAHAALIEAAAAAVAAHAEELSELDRAIGDGDHGLNMQRGLDAVQAKRDALAALPLPQLLRQAGMDLVLKVGGASGPLYGTLLMALGQALGEAGGPLDRAHLAAALRQAVDAVKARGRSDAGQKTLLDVLDPVHAAVARGATAAEIRAVALEAAEATKPLRAQRGRASFLGERSIGHVDPGARSCALLVAAVTAMLEASEPAP